MCIRAIMLRLSSNKMRRYLKRGLEILKQNKSAVLTALWMVTIGYIVLFEIQSDIIILGILGPYIISIFFYRLKSTVSFVFCFFILAFMSIEFIFTGVSKHTEKAAVLLFLFKAIGILQQLFFERNEKP